MGASACGVTSITVGSGTSLTLDLYPNATDDLILAYVGVRNTGATLSISGYTGIDSQQNNNSWASRWFVKKSTGSEASLTVASTSAGQITVQAYVIKGADVSGTALNAIDGNAKVSGSVGATCSSPSLTTGTNNCLLLHGIVWEATSVLCAQSDLNVLAAGYQQTSGVAFKGTAGAISTFTWTGSNAAKSGLSWVIAVKSATANQTIRATDGRTYLHRLGGYDTITTSTPDSVTGLTSILSVAMHTASGTASTGQPTTAPWALDGLKLSSAENLGTTAWVGFFFAITSANVSGKIVHIPYGFGGTVDSSRVATNGLIVVLADASNNYVAYQVLAQAKWTIQGSGTVTLKIGTSTTIASSGDPSAAVTKVGLFYQRATGSATSVDVYMGSPLVEGSTTAIIGGDSTNPVTVAYDAFLMLGGNTTPRALPYPLYVNSAALQGSGQFLNRFGLQYGDGTNETYVKLTAQSSDVPSTADTTWRVGASGVPLKIKASATDVHDLRSAIVTSSTLQPFTIDAASSLSASLLTTGLSVIGRTFSDLAGYDWTSVSWTECDTVAFKNGDVTTCTISSPNAAVHATTGAVCSFSANGATVDNSTINCTKASGSVAGYHLELGTAVTAITLTDVTFTGTPRTNKGHVLKTLTNVAAGAFVVGVHYRINTVGTTDFTAIGASANTIGVNFTATGVGSGTGTADQAVKITTSGTTSLAEADCTTAGAPVWVAAPVVSLTFTDLVAGSQVKVFATGTQTERFTTSSSGTSEVYSSATVETVDYTVMKAGYTPIRRTGYVIAAASTGSVSVPQTIDRTYAASSGLTYTTNCTIDTATEIATWSVATTGQNLYSFFIEAWIAQAALKNKEFPFSSNGPNSITFGLGWESRGFTTAGTGISNTSLALLSRDGLRYTDNSGVRTASWAAILTSGVPTGKQVRYQQSDAGTTVNAANTGEMDHLVQIYGDASHGNFDKTGYLVLKVQAEGYDQAETNAVTLYGTLEDQLYVVGLTPTANSIATGDPALTITISQGTYVEASKTFSVKIVDNATPSSGTDILRELRYNFAAGGTYQGEDAFNWHDLVQKNGSAFKTVNGNVYGSAAVKGVLVYASDGTTLHPDFTLFTADDGTTYVPAVTADISITSMPNVGAVPTRLQIINQTAEGATAWAANTVYATGAIVKRVAGLGSEQTAGLYFRATTGGNSHATTEPTWSTTPGNTTADNTVVWTCYKILYYDTDPAATSLTDTYIDGEEFKSGETAEIRFAEMNGSTSFKTYSTEVSITAAGFSALVAEEADSVFATFAIDGSTLEATFSPNFTSDYIVLDSNTDFSGKGAFAYYCYTLTTSAGMYNFWGGVTALDEGNIRINTSILNLYFDESAGFVKQTDDVRIFRSDGTRPALDPTTGTHGIEINWRTPVNVVTVAGASVVTGDQTSIVNAVFAQASTTPMPSNIKKVNDLTILGTGVPPTYDAEGVETDPGDPFRVA
jgi:hypothetical protein